MLSTGHSTQPWLILPTLAAKVHTSCLCLRPNFPASPKLSPLYTPASASRGEWSITTGCKFGNFGRVQKVAVLRLRSGPDYSERGQEDDSDNEDEAYASVDHAFFILRQSFYQICRAATKAARGWLPPIVSTQLISFTVGGVVLLTALWVLKAFLEIGCVAGTFIFAAVVAIRTLWSFLSYFGDSPVNGISPDDKGRYKPSFSQPE
eukprot:TRINITY_DN16943_c0_g1_i1.p1 TRINITY_DN16943_c0_g1~~TRINITY_DN16943_c0_g1_i1.p1  ORF type:complete len:236 (+),score=16.47 TRINITY_DN16943_c0_g1_i1:92-709(+)